MADDLHCLHELRVPPGTQPLYAVLSDLLPGLGRRKARSAIMAGLVHVDGNLAEDSKAVAPVDASLRIDLRQGIPARGALGRHAQTPAGPAPARPFTLLYQDEHLAIIDKASGISAAPTGRGEHGHVLELLREHWRREGRRPRFLGQVHRLDTPTSGCLVVALNRHAQRILGEQFSTHVAERRYRCLVAGAPRRDRDSLRGKLGRHRDGRRGVVEENAPGAEAITHFGVLRRHARGCELDCQLETGRTHQIRVHLAAIGCPVLGDRVYGPRDGRLADGCLVPPAPRLMLHAWTISLDHPRSGERLVVEAPLPACFAEVAATLD